MRAANESGLNVLLFYFKRVAIRLELLLHVTEVRSLPGAVVKMLALETRG